MTSIETRLVFLGSLIFSMKLIKSLDAILVFVLLAE